MWAATAFNIVMLGTNAAALFLLNRRATSTNAFVAVAGAAVAMAIAIGGGFGVLRLLAYGLFVHCSTTLFGAGWMLWKAHRWTSIAFLVGGLSVVAVGIDAFIIEPY